MMAWITYLLLVLLAGAIAIIAYLIFRNRTATKKEEFDATRDLFI